LHSPPRGLVVPVALYFGRPRTVSKTSRFGTNPPANRYPGRRAVVFGRRLESAGGAFLGVAVVNVEIGYSPHVYEPISALTDRAFLLARSDGVVLVRHPEPGNGAADRPPPSSPWAGAG